MQTPAPKGTSAGGGWLGGLRDIERDRQTGQISQSHLLDFHWEQFVLVANGKQNISVRARLDLAWDEMGDGGPQSPTPGARGGHWSLRLGLRRQTALTAKRGGEHPSECVVKAREHDCVPQNSGLSGGREHSSGMSSPSVGECHGAAPGFKQRWGGAARVVDIDIDERLEGEAIKAEIGRSSVAVPCLDSGVRTDVCCTCTPPMSTSGLRGSSLEDPWVFNARASSATQLSVRTTEHGRILAPVQNLAARRLNIRIGPPSTIMQLPKLQARAHAWALEETRERLRWEMQDNLFTPSVAPLAGPSRTSTTIRAARQDENHRASTGRMSTGGKRRAVPYDPNVTPPRNSSSYLRPHFRPGPVRIRRRNPAQALDFAGKRAARDHPLTTEDLYLDEIRPPPLEEPLDHHICGICLAVKSHPVSYRCGHGHCYVCIRLALETKFSCPTCSRVMFEAPFRHYDEEKSIRHDHKD
ncbi:hypothetical protein DFH07DRAFT_767558 [Mycena maculata]|uniref:RING-type domain-containing protein n=1 Tax=Mycena maculata TaxID=230809 RepID=A0AAD7JWX8_9AGAR|nr:hypothetical protein DFH07DRAFT_767558 [Mycena maculata]